MRALSTDRHFVYRVFGHDGALLYVGATSKRDERVREYGVRSEAVVVTFEEFPTRREAFAAERAAIQKLQPPWNTQSKGRTPVAFTDDRGRLRDLQSGQFISSEGLCA